jgi:hypothetical protein
MAAAPHSQDLPGVDTSPLSGSSASFRTAALREPDARRLLVVPSLGMRAAAFGLVACGLGVPAVMFARSAPGGWPDLIVTAAFCQIFTLAGALFWLAPLRAEFDLDAGVARLRSLGRREELPLADVLAVQVADGGVHRMSKGGTYRSYQLNLVLTDRDRPRLGLSNHARRAWTYEAGRRLAEFLSVPLLDSAGGEGGRTDPGGGDLKPL